MCINLETSLIAFTIGIGSSVLLMKSINEYNNIYGKFISFYSFVQLFEAGIYYFGNDNSTIFSRLLLMNLGSQGCVYFCLLSKQVHIHRIYFYITGTIASICFIESMKSNFKEATLNPNMRWNFLENRQLPYIFHIMHGSCFNYSFLDNKLENRNIAKATIIYVIITILSFAIKIPCNDNNPSLWCLSSVLAGPLLLLTNY